MTTKTLLAVLLLLAALPACGGSSCGDEGPTGPKEAPLPHEVRPAALAGRGWYPGGAEELGIQVDGFLDAASEWSGGRPLALIAPHAGYRFAGPWQGRVFAAVRGQRYGRVFLLGVPHRAAVRGVSLPDVTHYGTPLGKVPLDREAVDRLIALGPPFHHQRGAHDEEHSVEILLPFLQRAVPDLFIVPMLVNVDAGQAEAVAAGLREVLRPGDLVVASSDNTHYGPRFGYTPFPPGEGAAERLRELDLGAVERILGKDLEGYVAYREETGITTCGFDPICVLLALLPDRAKGTMTGYGASVAPSADEPDAVTYVGVAFTGADWTSAAEPAPLTEEEQALALRLARESMERWVRDGEEYDPEAEGVSIPAAFRRESGCFVTLKIGGELRGCIGDVLPRRSLLQAILVRARSSATEDGRFPPVSTAELPRIAVEISVLSPPRPVASPEEIVVGKHGILLSFDGSYRAVYLPQVAPEQGWDREETLTHLCRKGGLPGSAWASDRASFSVFTAQVFAEHE